jgi:hypothetical protein
METTIENNENIDLIQFSSPKYPNKNSSISGANLNSEKSNGILFPNKLFNNSNNWTDSSAYTSENNSSDGNELTSSQSMMNIGPESPTLIKSILPLSSSGGEVMASSPTIKTTGQYLNNDFTMNNDTIKITNENRNLMDDDIDATNLDVVDFIEVSNDCINVDQEDFW